MRKALTIGIISVLILAIAAGAAYTLWARAGDGSHLATGEDTNGRDSGSAQGGQYATCIPGAPNPVRYSYDDPKMPTTKLGEWVNVKDNLGRTVLRVRVTLENALPFNVTKDVDGKVRVGFLARFRMDVENLSCEPFVWELRSNKGLALGVQPKTSRWSGFVDSRAGRETSASIYIAENGKFEYENVIFKAHDPINGFMNYYRLPSLQEFPGKFATGITTGEFLIHFDMVDALVGPKNDYRLPLVLGGEYGFAKIELGRAKDLYNEHIGKHIGIDLHDSRWDDIKFKVQVTQKLLRDKR